MAHAPPRQGDGSWRTPHPDKEMDHGARPTQTRRWITARDTQLAHARAGRRQAVVRGIARLLGMRHRHGWSRPSSARCGTEPRCKINISLFRGAPTRTLSLADGGIAITHSLSPTDGGIATRGPGLWRGVLPGSRTAHPRSARPARVRSPTPGLCPLCFA